MAQSMTRLLNLLLVTTLLVSSIHSVRGYGNDEKVDDLFLEDESSGDGDDERFGSGARGNPDDEDSAIVNNPYDPNYRSPNSHKNPEITFTETKNNNPSSGGTSGTDIKIPSSSGGDGTQIFDTKHESPASFFSQPGILAAIICGAIVGLLCAILLVMFIVYRMRKKDEGSYVLEDSKRTTSSYGKTKEFYA